MILSADRVQTSLENVTLRNHGANSSSYPALRPSNYGVSSLESTADREDLYRVMRHPGCEVHFGRDSMLTSTKEHRAPTNPTFEDADNMSLCAFAAKRLCPVCGTNQPVQGTNGNQ